MTTVARDELACERAKPKEIAMQAQKQTATSPTQPDYFRQYGGSAPENYQRFFVPVIGAPIASESIQAAELRPGERVLDVACGTGVVTRLAAERVGSGKVVGLDLNPGMLTVARSVTAADAGIEWHEASADAMPLQDATFDVVLCQLGLQFVSNRLAALREMGRVLAPGGRVVATTVGPIPQLFAVFAEALVRNLGPDASRFVTHVFSLYDQKELGGLMGEAGFRDVRVQRRCKRLELPQPEQFLWQYVSSTPLAGAISKTTETGRASLERDVVAGWQRFVGGGRLLCEIDAIVTVGISPRD